MQKPAFGTDNNYLNIVITPDTNSGPISVQCEYNTTLTIPIVPDPKSYYLSIVRFTCPLDGIPLFVFPLDQSQNNPNASALIIGIRTSTNVDFPQRVLYVNQTAYSAPTPAGSSPYFNDSQASSQYYYMFSITQMINMINTALAAAVTASAIGGISPFFSYDQVTELITLNYNAGFIATGAKICINNLLINYLASFNYKQLTINVNPSPIGFDYNFLLEPLQTTLSQQFNGMSLWFDLRKIIITSNSLPVNQEVTPSINQNGVSSFLPILTDFAITFDTANQSKQVVVYAPTSQYRLVDLTGNDAITRLNFNFYWQDKFGTIYPVFLTPLQMASIKIGFFKKTIYNSAS